jgi:hypothetical protein
VSAAKTLQPLSLTAVSNLIAPCTSTRKEVFDNGATGRSDIEGKAAMGSGEEAGTRPSFNGATGRSDIEGKAAMGSGEEAGTRPSFNGVRWSRDDACDIEHVAIGNRAGRRQRS